MRPHEFKPGDYPPSYDEVYAPRRAQPDSGIRHVQTTMPWWNPRFWRKRVWAGIAAVIVIIVVIGVAVGVTEEKKRNAYPDYTEVSYSLSETFGGETFFDNFDYFTGYDPTSGFVHYVPQPQAEQLNLTYASADTAVLKVDTSVGPGDEPDASTGRFSVRVTSRSTYNNGLFIFDIKHSPFGCGTWPALWLTDPYSWPDNGEIDVMEAVNKADTGNQMTLHTSDGCSMSGRRKQTGDAQDSDCHHAANSNAGCGVTDDAEDSFGAAFNDRGGGVMALEWRDEGIRMWQFVRDEVPRDIIDKKPNPYTWGTAAADFPNTHCDVGSHFRNNSIVANINLCGELAEALYDTSDCPSNCTDYVANNPEAFTNAFWEFGNFEIYQAS